MMKKLSALFISAIILFSFSFCCTTKGSSKKPIQKNPSFKVTKATSNTWVGGQPGVRGYNVVISIDNPSVKLDSVYFRNTKTSLKKNSMAESPMFIGVFTLPNTKHDFVLHENPEKEYGNTPLKLNLPFSLKSNEAAVSYVYKKKQYYLKIENVEEVKSTEKY